MEKSESKVAVESKPNEEKDSSAVHSAAAVAAKTVAAISVTESLCEETPENPTKRIRQKIETGGVPIELNINLNLQRCCKGECQGEGNHLAIPTGNRNKDIPKESNGVKSTHEYRLSYMN